MSMLPLSHLARALAIATCLAPVCIGQVRLERHGPDGFPPSTPAFATAIVVLDDLDGDGLGEPATLAGGVRIFSTRTGRILRHLPPGPLVDSLPASLAVVGDLDGDGLRDVVVGYPDEDGGQGLVETLSVATGNRIFVIAGSPGWRFGESVCGVGDANFDSIPDFAVGAPNRSTTGPGGGPNVGLVRVHSGANGAALWSASIGGPDSYCGMSIDALGDLDGDGTVSIVFSAPGARRAYVHEVLGQPGLVTLVPLTPFNMLGDDDFGHVVAAVADLDGDGRKDVVVGAPEYTTYNFSTTDETGRVYAYSSWSGARLWDYVGDDTTDPRIGADLAGGEDVNSDGVPDVIVTGWSDERHVLSGANGASLSLILDGYGDRAFAVTDEDADGDGRSDLWFGETGTIERLDGATEGSGSLRFNSASGTAYGAAVAVLDDLDSDGVPEIAIGEPFAGVDGAGHVEIRSRGDVIDELTGPTPAGQFGAAIAALDDLDGDGFGDFVVGTPNARYGLTQRRGGIRVYSGLTRAVLRIVPGQVDGERFGASVARVPDADGDGVDDYAVGAPGWTSAGGTAAGRVYLYSGITGQQLYLRNGSLDGGLFGASVAGTSDVDGDGRGDLLVGAPREFTSVFDLFAGKVRCYSGASGVELFSVTGSQPSMGLGTSVSALDGDVSGDGIPDFIAGAPHYGAVVGSSGDGRAEVRSGADGSLLWSVAGAFQSRLGTSVLGLGDVDNDGVADFAIGEPDFVDFWNGSRGLVRLYSGNTNALFRTLTQADPPDPSDPSRDTPFGSSLAVGADVDGDRARDLVVGDLGRWRNRGAIEQWSARSLGSEQLGAGTPGCSGPMDLTLYRPANVGQTMTLRYGTLATGVQPLLFLGESPFDPGIEVLGVQFHLLPTAQVELPSLVGTHGEFVVPLPADPGLAGVQLSMQMFALWSSGCPQLPFSLSSSNALTVTFQ